MTASEYLQILRAQHGREAAVLRARLADAHYALALLAAGLDPAVEHDYDDRDMTITPRKPPGLDVS